MARNITESPSDVSIFVPEEVWTKYTPAIQARIIAEYQRIRTSMSESVYKDDEAVLWNSAVIHFLRQMEPSDAPKRSWFAENITGLMLIAFLLAIIFGGFGAWGLSATTALKDATSGFLDIAKLCAGALVGAAGASTVIRR